MRSLLIAAFALLMPVVGLAADEHYPGAPASVVAAYIEGDGEGLALDGETVSALLKYTTWDDAPGWDVFIVIKSYDIGEVGYDGDKASVQIIYHTLGTISGLTLTGKPGDEVVDFEVVKQGGKWKITGSQEAPHLTVAGARKALAVIGAKDDPAGRATLRKLSALE